MNEICNICGISRSDTKFYLNTQYGTNLCNKHYLQLRLKGKIIDSTQPNLNNKRIQWTLEEELTLRKLVEYDGISLKEISKILHRSYDSIIDKSTNLHLQTKYKNNVNYKAIYQDYDWCYQKYINEGLNHEEMAKEADASKRVIKKWCVEKHRLTQEYRQTHKELSNRQIDLIIGSMLGDGHIDRREDQPMFIVSHAENQKDYLYYKYDILKDFCNIPPTRKEEGYREFNEKLYLCQPSYRLCTRIQNCLLEYRGKTYTYLLNLMNEFSFSIWMLDDGYRSRSNWQLCVAEYTQEDIQNALIIFKDMFDIHAKQKKDKRYLDFDSISSRKIDEIILRNIPNDLDIIKYKITENDITDEQKILYVKYNNEEIKLTDFCKVLELNYKYVWQKLSRGSTIEEIVNRKEII